MEEKQVGAGRRRFLRVQGRGQPMWIPLLTLCQEKGNERLGLRWLRRRVLSSPCD